MSDAINFEGEIYYSVYEGNPRKRLHVKHILLQGVDILRTKVPGVSSVRLVEIFSEQSDGSLAEFVNKNVFDRFEEFPDLVHMYFFGKIERLKFIFQMEDGRFLSVLYSYPGYVRVNSNVDLTMKRTIQSYFKMTNLITGIDDEVNAKKALKRFCELISMKKIPTCSQYDFEEFIGRHLFEELTTMDILTQTEDSEQILCENPKKHLCKQIIYRDYKDQKGCCAYYCPISNQYHRFDPRHLYRYKLNNWYLIKQLQRILKIDGDWDAKETPEGVYYIGQTLWSGEKRLVYYAPMLWSPETINFLHNLDNRAHKGFSILGDERDNVLVIAPSSWGVLTRYPKGLPFSKRVKILYLKEILTYKDNTIQLDDSLEEDITFDDVVEDQFGWMLDRYKKPIDVRESNYKSIIATASEYQIFINIRDLKNKTHSAGTWTDDGFEERTATTMEAIVIANLVFNEGKKFHFKKFKDENGKTAFKNLNAFYQFYHRLRKKFDIMIMNKNSGKTEALRFQMEKGKVFYVRPRNEEHLLILPLGYEKTIFV